MSCIVTEILGFQRTELWMKWKYKFYIGRRCPKFLDFHPAFDTISSCYFTNFLMVFYIQYYQLRNSNFRVVPSVSLTTPATDYYHLSTINE